MTKLGVLSQKKKGERLRWGERATERQKRWDERESERTKERGRRREEL